ncbi:hypothetical protein H4R18_001484 [Coemansia javaensis]|uniref:Uncharacterized protein n=1 Tax=Coemansia javaensis TaxID=2761396 RepID=A0A9W8HJI6_9FUNG|nr:hypothetical protein H4R18_001484 [Coemansia javaensis]
MLPLRRALSSAAARLAPYPYTLIRDAAPALLHSAPQGGSRPAAALLFAAAGQRSSPSSIVGWILSGAGDPQQADVRPQDFVENRAFWPVVERVLAEHAHEDPELQALAAFQKTGWLNIPDQRNPPPPGRVGAAEDVLGCVRIDAGRIAPGSFQHNPAHRPVSAHGLFRLPAFLHARLVDRLARGA